MEPKDAERQRFGRFVGKLFVTGDAPGQSPGFFSRFRRNASPLDILSFVQNPEVLDATEKYLRGIHEMWIRSKYGQVPLVQKMEFSVLELPKNENLPVIVEKNLENLPPTPAVPLQQPESNFSPLSAPITPPPSPVVSGAQPSGSAVINQSIKPGQIPPSGYPQGSPIELRATFRLPNANVGQPYVGKLEGKDPTGKLVIILEAILPTALGLSFDVASSEVRGTPLLDGDYKLAIRWTADDTTPLNGVCSLYVNADPKSLWKKIEPDRSDPYFKENTDSTLLAGPGYRIAVASRRGRSHEHVGSFRDDDFFINHDAKSGWNVLIVADGAGSAKSSRWGSKLAVEAAGAYIASNLAGQFGAEMTQALSGWSADMASASKAMNAPFYLLFQEASKLAVQAIESEAQANSVPPKEYSTTLLAAAVRRDGNETFLATFWMGDGAIAAYGPKGSVRLMGTPDSGEFAGQTRFLDRSALNDQGFGKRIGLGRYTDLTAVMLMTDGISDPRFETDNGLADREKWDALWSEITPSLTSSEPDQALVGWLDFFSPGHHDDRTIAVLW